MLKFYTLEPRKRAGSPDLKGLKVVNSVRSAREAGVLTLKLAAEMLMHKYLLRGTFSRYLILRNGQVAHQTTVLGKTPRLPFMRSGEVCISYAWTAGAYRRRGLYAGVLSKVLDDYYDRTVWIFARRTNTASLSGIEKLGFGLVGFGRRTAPLGFRWLGRFVIKEQAQSGRRIERARRDGEPPREGSDARPERIAGETR